MGLLIFIFFPPVFLSVSVFSEFDFVGRHDGKTLPGERKKKPLAEFVCFLLEGDVVGQISRPKPPAATDGRARPAHLTEC